ncbi:pentapeptide repeat-containing protein [Amycolatopsis sp.]|uniref:pentapeptide repeat-containing protein n=1 Tax=Amycolatopsis sp. TaxID=37632 RepID=UPI002F422428
MALERDSPGREFSWVWVWLTLSASLLTGLLVAAVLWGSTRAEHRDAFDTGWKSAAAVLAILAAVITVERLRLGQREHYRQLASDRAREITELSAKASEQLGSEKAAVRIGGLTDLERLGQSYPQLRQTVIDRICAYLRGPYEPPPDRTRSGEPPGDAEPKLDAEEIAARRLELDVRRTAQNVLRRHLRPPGISIGEDFDPEGTRPEQEAYWEEVRIDLRDAVLVEFDLANCRLWSADFQGATFHGPTDFHGTDFDGQLSFAFATFVGRAFFSHAEFRLRADFGSARFDQVSFRDASFPAGASFRRAHFREEAVFERSDPDVADFSEATFSGPLRFERVTFRKSLNSEIFDAENPHRTGRRPSASFVGAKFEGDVRVEMCVFQQGVRFTDAVFEKRAIFVTTRFSGGADFAGASFKTRLSIDGGNFTGPVDWSNATFAGGVLVDETFAVQSDEHRWPDGWGLAPEQFDAHPLAGLVRDEDPPAFRVTTGG